MNKEKIERIINSYMKIILKRLPRVDDFIQNGDKIYIYLANIKKGVIVVSKEELLKGISERAEEESNFNFWNPEKPGDYIIFYAQEKRTMKSKFQGSQERWLGKDENGDIKVLPGHTVIDSKVQQNKWNYIEYKGEETGERGTYKNYKVTTLHENEIKELGLEPDF